MKYLIPYISALLFGLGLGIAGMTDPDNVIGFLDIAGDWRPALMFVMVGAIFVQGTCYFLIKKRQAPLLAPKFYLPSKKDVDRRLLLGASLFGCGWGIGGYCPGPALVSLVTGSSAVGIFTLSMVIGIAVYHYLANPLVIKWKARY